MPFPGSMELVRLVVGLGVPVSGLRVLVLLIGKGTVMVLLGVVELIFEVVLEATLVEEIEIRLAPLLEVGKLKV